MTAQEIARIITQAITDNERIIANNQKGIEEIKADILKSDNFTPDTLRNNAKRIESRQREIAMCEYCIKELKQIIEAIKE